MCIANKDKEPTQSGRQPGRIHVTSYLSSQPQTLAMIEPHGPRRQGGGELGREF
jgi:hypothetical protein